MLIEEIKRQPEPLLREVLHYMKFLARLRAQEDWADVLPGRQVEQEVLDILDSKCEPAPRGSLARGHGHGCQDLPCRGSYG